MATQRLSRLHGVLFTLAVLLTTAAGAHAQLGWQTYPQPDGGSIELPADWIVLRLADPVTVESPTFRKQLLLSARGVYEGIPIVLNVIRTSPSPSSPDLRARALLQGRLVRMTESRWMASPSGATPPGMKSASAYAAFRSGSDWSHMLCVVAAGAEADYNLFLTSPDSLEGRVAPIRAALLQRWRPSQEFRDTSAISLPAREPTTVRFESGGRASLPANWFVLETDAESEDYDADFLADGSRLNVQQLLNAQRFDVGASMGDVVHLFRAKVASEGGELVWIDRRMFNLIANELIARHQGSWPGDPGPDLRDRSISEAVGVVLSPTEMGMHGAILVWRAGDECLLGFSTSQSADGAVENLRELRLAYSPRYVEQARRDLEQRATAERIGRGFGAALLSLVVFGIPAIVGSFFGLRWAVAGLLLPFLCCGSLQSYGTNAIASWGSASSQRELSSPHEVLMASALALPLETFGESIPVITRSTMSELAWRATGGEGHAWLVMGSVIGLGAAIWLAVPLLARFVLLRRRLRSRFGALAVGLAWWFVVVLGLVVLSSANEGHRVGAMGAAVMTMLLMPPRTLAGARDVSSE